MRQGLPEAGFGERARLIGPSHDNTSSHEDAHPEGA
jgi:hypothetical protein